MKEGGSTSDEVVLLAKRKCGGQKPRWNLVKREQGDDGGENSGYRQITLRRVQTISTCLRVMGVAGRLVQVHTDEERNNQTVIMLMHNRIADMHMWITRARQRHETRRGQTVERKRRVTTYFLCWKELGYERG